MLDDNAHQSIQEAIEDSWAERSGPALNAKVKAFIQFAIAKGIPEDKVFPHFRRASVHICSFVYRSKSREHSGRKTQCDQRASHSLGCTILGRGETEKGPQRYDEEGTSVFASGEETCGHLSDVDSAA